MGDMESQRQKFKQRSESYRIEKGEHIETVKLFNFQRKNSFVLKEIGVNIVRLLCANKDTEFGRQAQEALETNKKTCRTRVHGLSQLVALAQNDAIFSFDENNIPYVIRDFEVTGVYIDHLWDALAFLGFAVSSFLHSRLYIFCLRKILMITCLLDIINLVRKVN
jgi:hypothetical protein